MSEVTFRLFKPSDASAFRELNEEWIRELFTLEEKDHEVLGDPQRCILDSGGAIIMAIEGSRAVGSCALVAMGGDSYELVKMAIAKDRRGKGLGRRLLAFVIDHARSIRAARLYLETNTKLANAIHLYASAGFRRVPPVHPTHYTRVDVFMERIMDGLTPMDVEGYLLRIGHTAMLTSTVDTLRSLHLAHATNIPFENLDILLGKPIRIDVQSIVAKLVHGGRGGYCYEHNTLFAAVLEAAGFRVKRLAARVRNGSQKVLPRTHMIVAVELDGESWLADVGFGGEGLLYPLPLRPGEIVTHLGWTYRIVQEGWQYVLQSLHPEGWFDLYAFTLEEQYTVDYEVANYFVSTHPRSRFVRLLLAQKPGVESRLALVNRRLTEQTPTGASEVILPHDAAVLQTLGQRFGLHFPDATRFVYDED